MSGEPDGRRWPPRALGPRLRRALGAAGPLGELPLRWRLWLLYVALLAATLGGLAVVLGAWIDGALVAAELDDASAQVATVVRRAAPSLTVTAPRAAGPGLGDALRSADLPVSPDPRLPVGPDGRLAPNELRELARRTISALNGRSMHLRFYDREGAPLLAGATDPEGPGVPAVTAEALLAARRGVPSARVVAERAPRVGLALLPVSDPSGVAAVVALSVSLAAADATAGAIRLAVGGAACAAILLGGLVGLPATRALLRPLERVVAAADRARGGDLGARAGLAPSTDEVGRLGAAFDEMLGQIQASFEAQRSFVADASHELRSPIGGLAGMLDVLAGLDPEDEASRRRALRAMAREVERVRRLVEDLLLLSRLESRRPELEALDLAAVVEEEIETLALVGRQPIRFGAAARPLVAADRHALARLVRNVLENALAATAAGGEVWVDVELRDGAAHLRVRDTGSGIAPEALPHVFDRFYRADPARARAAAGGAGLGLAIVRAIATAHGGEATLESDGVGRGATFRLRLPLLQPP